MPPLLDIATLRAALQTDIGDAALSLWNEQAEAEIVKRWGANYDGGGTITISKEFQDWSMQTPQTIFLERRIGDNTTILITEYPSDSLPSVALIASDYRVLYNGYAIERLGTGAHPSWNFAPRVDITYRPEDDTPRRKGAIVDLVRLSTRRSGAHSQSSGDTSEVQVDSHENERAAIIEALGPAIAFS